MTETNNLKNKKILFWTYIVFLILLIVLAATSIMLWMFAVVGSMFLILGMGVLLMTIPTLILLLTNKNIPLKWSLNKGGK